MSLKDIADRLNLSRASGALFCQLDDRVPEEKEIRIATMLGLVQMRLTEFSHIYRIAYDNAGKRFCGMVYRGCPGDHAVFHFENAVELLDILTREYEILKSQDM